VSLRARLTLVLASLMAGPLVAAWIAVGVLVPHTTNRSAQAAADRSAGAAALALSQRCGELADTARTLAYDVRARLSGGGRLDAMTARLVVAGAVDRPGITVAVLTGSDLLAAAGPLADRLDAAGAATAAEASCSRRQAVASGPALLAESVPVSDGEHEVARAVALRALDTAGLGDLVQQLGLTGGIVLVRSSSSGTDPEVVASSRRLPELGPVLADATAGDTSGAVAGMRYRWQAEPPGVPYAVLAVEPIPGGALEITLVAVLLAAMGLSFVLVRVLADRLTQPLARLTGAVQRLGTGDLDARAGAVGAGEVATLAAAFDTMADQLRAKIGELEAGRDALRDTFDRFGEALGRTHDLDGLLYTVIEAAMLGADGVVGTALLGDARSLEERVSAVREGGPTAVISALDDLARLAAEAVRRGDAAVVLHLPSAGPAIAVPMARGGRTIGALAVARGENAPPLDSTATHAVAALAMHAGTAVSNVRAHEETRRQSVTDPLTGAGNFRQLTTTLNREIERATRFTRPLSVLMLDLDHFKQVNDTQGHAFGDAVLREFARRLTDCLREVDVVARYGGEEFAVVLPETDSSGACAVATRVVGAIRSQPFDALGRARTVTVSVGVASFPDHGRTAAEVMRAADGALYAAKRAGRDRWCLAGHSGEGKTLSVAR